MVQLLDIIDKYDLIYQGFVDNNGYNVIDNIAKKLEAAGSAGEWAKVVVLTQEIENLVANITNNMDWYNILKKVDPSLNSCKKT